MKKIIPQIFILFLCLNITAQEIRLKKGSVTDSLPIFEGSEKTFALYVPTTFTQEKKWPVIFAFDPQGRGAATANLFRSAAEQQQYVVVASNFSLKREALDTILNSAGGMINSVSEFISLDENQMYGAGLAEGAQVASTLPLFKRGISGIMAIGNAFANPRYIDRSKPYVFVGMAGSRDYMVYEIEKYLQFYDKINFPTDVHYFNGMENEWPDVSVITNGVNMFTIHAMKTGKRPVDEQLIQQIFDSEMDYIERQHRLRNSYQAYQALERMEKKYEDFGFEDIIENKLKEIKKTDAFRSQRNEFRQVTAFERQQQDEYEYLLESDIYTNNFQNIGWWAFQMDELEKLKEDKNQAKANMAYRLHGYLDFLTEQYLRKILQLKVPIDNKIFVSVLRTAIVKDDPEAYLQIISLAGADGDMETALMYLEDLLKTGYSDMQSLYEIEGTLGLQFTREYNAIIKKYLGKSKFYNNQSPEEEN